MSLKRRFNNFYAKKNSLGAQVAAGGAIFAFDAEFQNRKSIIRPSELKPAFQIPFIIA
jgi:hypothetical protein